MAAGYICEYTCTDGGEVLGKGSNGDINNCQQKLMTSFKIDRMSALIGSWQSVESNIPGYVPGGEWLHFFQTEPHRWEIPHTQDSTCTKTILFKLHSEGDGRYRLLTLTDRMDDGSGLQWEIAIRELSETEIAVTPQHKFITIFRRVGNSPAADAGGAP